MFLITIVNTSFPNSRRLRMPSMLVLVLQVLFESSASIVHAQKNDYPLPSSEGLFLADIEVIHKVDTPSNYIDLCNWCIGDSSTIRIIDSRNIYLVCQDIYRFVQDVEEAREVAYNIHYSLQQVRHSCQERYTKIQDKNPVSLITNNSEAPVLISEVQATSLAHNPRWLIPAEITTKRKENGCVVANHTASSYSKSNIYYSNLCAYIGGMRHSRIAYTYLHKSRICLHKRIIKDIYLITSVLSGPAI